MKLNKKQPQTDYERLFAELLEVFGADYAPQVLFHDTFPDHYGVGRFCVDFVVPCRSLVFEVDGPSHSTWQQRRIDRMRDEFLRARGFTVVRVQHKELDGDLHAVASRVYRLIFED